MQPSLFSAGRHRRARQTRLTIVALAASALFVPLGAQTAPGPETDSALTRAIGGRSGALRALFVHPAEAPRFQVGALTRLFGDSTYTPGVYSVQDSSTQERFSLISLLPFSAKRGSRIGTYNIGFWPAERRGGRGEQPVGFVEVTIDNQETHVSENFRLKDFLTHDQQPVWPKYLVLREELVEKLELVIHELRAMGVSNPRMVVMSGFRTPQYNAQGLRRGRARDSRHQYGDAADVFVDADGNGRMDDLNRDGRVNKADATILAKAFERIEQQYPDLTGGVAIYKATRAHGPFVHVDVRGERARWASN